MTIFNSIKKTKATFLLVVSFVFIFDLNSFVVVAAVSEPSAPEVSFDIQEPTEPEEPTAPEMPGEEDSDDNSEQEDTTEDSAPDDSGEEVTEEPNTTEQDIIEEPEEPTAPEEPTEPSEPTQPQNQDEEATEEPTAEKEDTSDSEEILADTEPDADDLGSVKDQSNSLTDDGSQGDNQVGDTSIETGDATVTASVTNEVNSNQLVSGDNDGPGDITIENSGNGEDSDNSGSVSVEDANTAVQENDADLGNCLDVESDTGNNSASRNVGNSSIDTGDANVSGTVSNFANSNIDGVSVNEFNVADDHVGDIVLEIPQEEASHSADLSVTTQGNGSGSENSGELDMVTREVGFQSNDASLGNELILAADTGNNNADNNTGGNSEIETGDANVSGNVLNFLNNNVSGGIYYTVVNIFGDLVGDIVLSEEQLARLGIANSGNGSGSVNSGEINYLSEDQLAQFNDAEILNEVQIDANTGGNHLADNTGGNNSIETGDANVDAQVVSIANNNLAGGNWWLVIVNEAGEWVGRILGAPEGQHYAGASGTEFRTEEDGTITVTNAGNGSDSENEGSVEKTTQRIATQENTASVNNKIQLSANTGGNSASRNTGGDNSIKTGDANVLLNLINFVNNNFKDTNIFVTMVNVFGSWVGDFVGPGYEKQEEPALADSGEETAQSAEDAGDGDTSGNSGANDIAIGGPDQLSGQGEFTNDERTDNSAGSKKKDKSTEEKEDEEEESSESTGDDEDNEDDSEEELATVLANSMGGGPNILGASTTRTFFENTPRKEGDRKGNEVLASENEPQGAATEEPLKINLAWVVVISGLAFLGIFLRSGLKKLLPQLLYLKNQIF